MPAVTLESALERFTSTFAESARITEEGKSSIPGGYSRTSFNFGPHAIFVERGEGAYIDTVDGVRMLDLNNNFTVNLFGHNHAGIRDALLEAIPSGVSFGNPVSAEAELADILIDRVPSVEKVRFSCSATESCMSAVRIARAYSGRQKIAKFEGGYHGFSDTLMITSHMDPHGDHGPDDAPNATPDSGGIPENLVSNVVLLPQNDLASCETILREKHEDIACLIMELQSGAGGLVALDREFVTGLRAITRELGIVLIFDETISLRAGYHGLQGEFGVVPDLTVMGKIIGGGMPLGAVGGSAEVMKVLEDGRAVISGTHHGHKLSLAAGIACMKAIDETVIARLNAHARRIKEEINDWSRERGSAFRIHGYGFSHLGYAYMKDSESPLRNHRDHNRNVDAEKTQTVSLELANRGFFPVHRGELSLSVPMTDDDITSIITTLQAIVSDMED
ncbi:glutamate-1-semialdehyde 2,1-aminomutase [Brevibacterium sanguinis]|uniref:Glutamate-1-semialdehyde 2,1-aminomutase n=2 Tax=Brevibacterium TaxID=1696 RepID=A0A366IR67_9MICO|nr:MULTISPECIES: aminotransferase class III-fold pyridoxal phosphate-dependent enzyme [Brevibacterium]RBP67817.1 glutamate-1-semialdehyde 2,1-aminomutase [Brevibacterium sanguinis]RBP74766.1 glutamate-1-semialdehyde 2,1-aminomutase [Brevibacterium celere]